MSSIRLYILDALARRGDMHGHQLRLLAEQEHVHLWTDFSVGALYGALKRLAAEGLLAEVRTEREGGYPERQVYGITDAGRAVLGELHRQHLEQVAFKPDPFDLALSRPDPTRLDDLSDALEVRLSTLRRLLADTEHQNARAKPYLSLGETHALLHREHRLRAELAWHEELAAALPDVVADERARALTPEPLPTAPPAKTLNQKDPHD
ncbi:PadR family transcriptional regulator [Microlunatus flavus]|uniref:DNA-binding transcriptional regulator, PadR family n=1 Tax=Microlunatus flavus TaxID=1036181 RepID=A0A1H9LX29_9ACTN|nr:PadR family transcriptional regulator [Microlunatus flavus]SER16006.1 DNA-binding transcriptional regulator, PadR family [Microlunatus flavus]